MPGISFHLAVSNMTYFSKILLLIIVGIFFASSVLASTVIGNPIKAKNFNDLVILLANWVEKIAIAIATVMIIYSGYLFVSARGKDEGITKAKKSITYALVGLAIIIIGGDWVGVMQDFYFLTLKKTHVLQATTYAVPGIYLNDCYPLS